MAKIYDIKTLEIGDVLDFGKHNGEQLYYVIYHFPYYVKWCLETIEKFDLDREAYDMLETALFNYTYSDS